MKTNKIPVPKKSFTRMSEKSNEAYSTINRAVINKESTSIPFQNNKIHAQSMEKFGFQKSTIPKHQSGQISTLTNYSSYRPPKLYYHRTQNKPITEDVRSNIRSPNQSIEQLEAKISSSSPQVFEQDINKGLRAANQPNEQLATKKDIELLGDKICKAISKMGKEMGKEIGKEIGKQLTDISQKLSDISKKIDLNSSSGSLSRSKNSNGNNSIHSFPKYSFEKDSSRAHYNYNKRDYKI